MRFNKLPQFRNRKNQDNEENCSQENISQVFDLLQEEKIKQNQSIEKCKKSNKLYQQQPKQQIVKSEFCKIYKDFMFDESDLKESQFFYNSEYFKNNLESQKSQIQFSQIYQENSINLKQRSKNQHFLLFQIKFLYFTFKIRVHNTTKDEDFDQWLNRNCEVIGRGAEGEVLKYQKHAIKRFSIDQNLQKVFQRVISQYSFLKILSCYKCVPKMQNLFGFDIICTNQSICFSFQVGIPISNTEQINIKKCNNAQKDLKQNLRILHSLRIIHYDIKPSNIIYSASYNKFVFIDFGMSEITPVMFGFMQKETYKGTFFYSSPQMKKILSSKQLLFLDPYYNDMYCLKKTINNIKNQVILQKQNPSKQINQINFFLYGKDPFLEQKQKENLKYFQILNLIFQRNIKGVNQFYLKNKDFFCRNIEKLFLCFSDLKICFNIIQIFQKYFLPNLGEKKQEFQSIFMQRVNQMEEIEINYIPEKQNSIKYQFFLQQQKSANSILQISKQSSQKSNRLDQICKQASRIQLFYCYLKDFLKICKKNIFKIKKEEEKKQINQGILIFNNLLFEQQSLKISLNSQLNQTIVKNLNNLQNDQLLCSDTFNFENLEFQFTIYRCLKLLTQIWYYLKNHFNVLKIQKRVIKKHRSIIKFIFFNKVYSDLQGEALNYLKNIIISSLDLSTYKLSQMQQVKFILKQFCQIIDDFKFRNQLLSNEIFFLNQFIVFKQYCIRFSDNDHKKIILKAWNVIELLKTLNKKHKTFILGTKKMNQMYLLKILICLQRYYFLNQQYYELFKIYEIFFKKFNESFEDTQNSPNLHLINLRIQQTYEKLKLNKKSNNIFILLQKIQNNLQNDCLSMFNKNQQKTQKKLIFKSQDEIFQIQKLILRFQADIEKHNLQIFCSSFLKIFQKNQNYSFSQQYFFKMYNILKQHTNFEDQLSIKIYLKLISSLTTAYSSFKINKKIDQILNIMINQLFQMILIKNCFKNQYPAYLFSLGLKFIQQSKDSQNINQGYWKQIAQKYQLQNLQKLLIIQFCQYSIFNQRLYLMYYLKRYKKETEQQKIQNQFKKIQELKQFLIRKKTVFCFLNNPWYIQCGKILVLEYINNKKFKQLFQFFHSLCQFLNDFPSDHFSMIFKSKYVKLLRKFLCIQQIIVEIKKQMKHFLTKINLNNCKLMIYVLFAIYSYFSSQQHSIEESFLMMKKIEKYINHVGKQIKNEILQKYYTVLIKIKEQRQKNIINFFQIQKGSQSFEQKYLKQKQRLSKKVQFYIRKKLRSYQAKNSKYFIQQYCNKIKDKYYRKTQRRYLKNRSNINIFICQIKKKLKSISKLKQQQDYDS